MISLLTIVTLCGLIYFLSRRLVRKRKGVKITARTRSGIETWVATEVAGIVAKKLALSPDDISRTMGGDPDPEIVSAVERVVASVELVYEKVATASDAIELRAEVAFEDGTTQRATRTLGSPDLPEAVREEFSRTGASRVHRAWAMPWSE